MLEILALIKLTRVLNEIAEQKGRSKAWSLLGVLMWFAGELMGFAIGIALGFNMGAYLTAIVLALAGAFGSWMIVKSLSSKFEVDPPIVDTAVEGVAADPNNPFSPPRR